LQQQTLTSVSTVLRSLIPHFCLLPQVAKDAEDGDDDVADDVAEGDSHRKLSRSSNSSGDRRKNRSGEAVYRAPRLAATPYEEEAAAVKADKKAARRKDKLRKGEILETLQAEFGDRPEVVRAGAGLVSEQDRAAMDAEDSERRDFEEDHMIRLVSHLLFS
jgi:hypothetical protein